MGAPGGQPAYILCATDPGGASNVAPLAALLGVASCRALASAATAGYFRSCGMHDVTLAGPDEDAGDLIERVRPAAVVCGTTRYVSPDRRIVAEARRRHVPSVVVLDEWYLYAHRFRDEEGDLAFLPDVVCVPDDVARREARDEGIPEHLLEVTGSPALSALCDRLERFSNEPPVVPTAFEGSPRPWILFLSETHRADFGDAISGSGPLGSFLGYTEQTVAADLEQIVRASGRDCTVLEKLHPAAGECESPLPVLQPGQTWIRAGREPLAPLLWHADLVVGMRSVALLEASLAGRPTVAYQPDLAPEYEPSTAERLGFVPRASTRGELAAWLTRNWNGMRRPLPPRPAFAAAESPRRVFEVVMRLAQAVSR